jgi:hypothetical protein
MLELIMSLNRVKIPIILALPDFVGILKSRNGAMVRRKKLNKDINEIIAIIGIDTQAGDRVK